MDKRDEFVQAVEAAIKETIDRYDAGEGPGEGIGGRDFDFVERILDAYEELTGLGGGSADRSAVYKAFSSKAVVSN